MSTSPRNVQPSRVPPPGRSPLTVTTPPRTTLVDIIRRDPRASRGLDDRIIARTPR